MSATVQAPRPASLNRRRRVRQKVHAPAYATFGGASKSGMLDLYEVLDISEVGVALQCAAPLRIDPASRVVSGSGRGQWRDFRNCNRRLVRRSRTVGLRLAPLPRVRSAPLARVAISQRHGRGRQRRVFGCAPLRPARTFFFRPSYTDMLAAASAVQSKPSPWDPISRRFSPWLLPGLSLCFGLPERQLPLPQKTPEKMTRSRL